jgi:hypothetical protein
MVKEAIAALGGASTNVKVRDWILEKYPGTNPNTIQCQIIVSTVNHPSRIHYSENKNPRVADGQYDFLFRTGRGCLELYDPARHGVWRIVKQDDGSCQIAQADEAEPNKSSSESSFAEESHLRDFLEKNLSLIEPDLHLFVDENENVGVEYATPVGRIDILAIDAAGGFVVIELKVSKGPDAVAGQVLRYKNWVKMNLAGSKRVRGIILAQDISDKIRYAIAADPDISVKQYDLSLKVYDVQGLNPKK